MRCTKCGKITFDFLETCPSCGQDLSAVMKALGGFVSPGDGLCWFAGGGPPDQAGPPAGSESEEGYKAPVNLSDIDVSDLIEEDGRPAGEAPVAIDPDTLKGVAEDEEFRKALDELIPDET